jgi:two-component system chemotaxis response regulator CheB
VRVLVVDDSAFARKVLREVLARAPGLEVVGVARDGLEALEKVAELAPDVVTLDLVMPSLDGVGVLHALAQAGATCRVVVVSSSGADSDLGVEALQSGAAELVQKPTALATDRLFELADALVAAVRAAAAARPLSPPSAPPARPPAAAGAGAPGAGPALPAGALAVRLAVLGTSTGGPQALTRLVSALPADLPVPLAIALHIPFGYTEALAQRLDAVSAVRVVEASEGLVLAPGMVAIAPGGLHLKLEEVDGRFVARLDVEPLTTAHRPSVDVLFASAVRAAGPGVLGLVLTGMGDDGLQGARAIRAAGGHVLTEAESSCVVYGMPRVVDEAGLSSASAPLEALAPLLDRWVRTAGA